jgi:hypothetical protein
MLVNDEVPGRGPENNLFFKIFGRGVQFGGNPVNHKADGVDEEADLSIEELRMVRVAQVCGEAPETMHATHGAVAGIQNFWPIARLVLGVEKPLGLGPIMRAQTFLLPDLVVLRPENVPAAEHPKALSHNFFELRA